ALAALVITALVAAACAGGGSNGSGGPATGGVSSVPAAPTLPVPVIVITSPTSGAWVRLLRAAGASAREGTWQEMISRGAGVVPGDAPLSADEVASVGGWVRSGGRVATPDNAVLDALGVARTPYVNVSSATMTGLEGTAQWPDVVAVRPLAGTGWNVLARSGAGADLMGTRALGKGQVVALAVDPLAGALLGYELLPWAASAVASAVGAPPGPRLEAAQVYVDPGGLSGPLKGNPGQIASELSA